MTKSRSSIKTNKVSKRSPKISPKRSPAKLRLVKITKSPIKGKKLRAQFSDGTHTDFGAAGMGDHIIYSRKSKELGQNRKKAYISRHQKREKWGSPKTAGALSRWILWNKPSLKASIADYKRKFKM